MDSLGEGTRPCPFPVTGNGHGRVTEPENDQFCGRYLGMFPNRFIYALQGPEMSQNVAKSFKKIEIATFGSNSGHLTDFQRKRLTDICSQAYIDLTIALFCVIGLLNEPYWDT